MSEDRFSVEEHFDNHSRSMSHKDFRFFQSIINSGVKFYFKEMGVEGNADTPANKAKFDKFIANADNKFREASLKKKGIHITRTSGKLFKGAPEGRTIYTACRLEMN